MTLDEVLHHLTEIVEKLSAGDEVVLTRNDRPVATLRAVPSPEAPPPQGPRPGTLKGTNLDIASDFDAIPEGFEHYITVRVLPDTHTIFWSVEEPPKLSPAALAAVLDPANARLVSAATVWELAIEVGQGKIALSLSYRQWQDTAIAGLKPTNLPIKVEYAERQATLPPRHKDPFHRLMIAQALLEDVPIVSVEAAFDPHGVTRPW